MMESSYYYEQLIRRMSHKRYRTVSIVVLAGLVVALAATAFQKAQSYIAQGVKDSQKLRVAGSDTCDASKGETPHFGGCSSIL